MSTVTLVQVYPERLLISESNAMMLQQNRLLDLRDRCEDNPTDEQLRNDYRNWLWAITQGIRESLENDRVIGMVRSHDREDENQKQVVILIYPLKAVWGRTFVQKYDTDKEMFYLEVPENEYLEQRTDTNEEGEIA